MTAHVVGAILISAARCEDAEQESCDIMRYLFKAAAVARSD
jgi:hypothetical protein